MIQTPAAGYLADDEALRHDVLQSSQQEFITCAHEMAESHGPLSCQFGLAASASHACVADEHGNVLLTIAGLGATYDRVIVDFDAHASFFILRAWRSDGSAATRQTLPLARRLSATADVRICWSGDGRDLFISVPCSSFGAISYTPEPDINPASRSLLHEAEQAGAVSDTLSCESQGGWANESPESHYSS